MKKLFMLFAVLSFVGLSTVNAQTCTKSASASKSCCSATVAKAASMDDSIEKRTCETSGKVSYVRKEVCSTSGKTSYTNVEYDASTKKFVNISPTHNADAAKKSCTKGKASCTKGKSSCTKKSTTAVKKTTAAKAVKTSNE